MAFYIQVPSYYVDNWLNPKMLDLLTISYCPISYVIMNYDSRMFHYYYSDKVQEGKDILKSWGVDFNIALCKDIRSTEFTGGQKLIIDDFERNFLNETLASILIHQSEDLNNKKLLLNLGDIK